LPVTSAVLRHPGEYTYFFNHPDYCVSTVQAARSSATRLAPGPLCARDGARASRPGVCHSGSASPCTWDGRDRRPRPRLHSAAAALGNHLALRLVEGDFHYSDVKYGAQTAPVIEPAARPDHRLPAEHRPGMALRNIPRPAASFGCECSRSPSSPHPIAVTGRVINLEEAKNCCRLHLEQQWRRITGNAGGPASQPTAWPRATTSSPPRQRSSGPAQHAECSASFPSSPSRHHHLLLGQPSSILSAESPPSRRRGSRRTARLLTPTAPPRPDHRHRHDRNADRRRCQAGHRQRHLQRGRR